MSVTIEAETPPLREDGTGAIRVGSSRVLLELVIEAFRDGATPEAIVQAYSTTTLADVYGVIAYYLRHREAIESYLAEREVKAVEVQKRIEATQRDVSELRDRIKARRKS